MENKISSWMSTWDFMTISLSEWLKLASSMTVSISIVMLLFQTPSNLEQFYFIRNMYEFGIVFPLLSTPILLFCCAYQRKENVVFYKFKEIDYIVCAVNFSILAACTIIIAAEAVHVAICSFIATVLYMIDGSRFVIWKWRTQHEPAIDSFVQEPAIYRLIRVPAIDGIVQEPAIYRLVQEPAIDSSVQESAIDVLEKPD